MNSTRVLRGIGVSPGVAFGPAMIVRFDVPDVPNRTISAPEVETEIRRLRDAAAHVGKVLEGLRDRVLERAGVEESHIFDAQILMVQDADILGEVEQLIRQNCFSAETAYEFKALETRALWESSGSAVLRDRLADLSAIQIRMLQHLTGMADEEPWESPSADQVIVVAHELSPGLTVQLDREHVVGLVSEEGTRTSHAAILAHSLGIPAVMGVYGALRADRAGTLLLLDGQSGTVLHRSDPCRAGTGAGPDLPPAEAGVRARARGPPAGRHPRRARDHADGQRGPARRDRARGSLRRAGRGAAPHRVPGDRAGPRCRPKTSRPTTSAGWRTPFPATP